MTKKSNSGRHSSGQSPSEPYANETMKLLLERSSCRSFESKPIPDNILDEILGAGIHAATGGNLQPYSIIKIAREGTKKRLAELCEQEFIGTAPIDLLFCLDYHRLQRWAEAEHCPFSACNSFRHFWIGFQDVIITAQNICTAADALGLGSVYIGTVLEHPRHMREMFALPNGVYPVVLLCLGYPKIRPQPRKKLGTEIIVHNEKYEEPSSETLAEAFEKKFPVRDHPNFQMAITDERMETIGRACRQVHGPEFEQKCLQYIRQTGYIPMPHRYFGLHYTAHEIPLGNEDSLKSMEEFGFRWFRQWLPRT